MAQTISAIYTYEQMEIMKMSILENFKSILERKLKFYEKIKKGFRNYQEILDFSIGISEQILQTEQKVHRYSETFPQTSNTLLVLFYGEIQGCLKSAYDILQKQKLNFYRSNYASLIINVFSEETASINVSIGSSTGKIERFSAKLPQVLEYTQSELEGVDHVKDIIPYIVAQKHDDLVNQFLNGEVQGENLININRHFWIKTKNNFIKRIVGFLTMNPFQKNELPFTLVIDSKQEDHFFILINEQLNVSILYFFLLCKFYM